MFATGNVSVSLVDSGSASTTNVVLPPLIGDGGHLAHSTVNVGDLVWLPARQENLVVNGHLYLGQHMQHHPLRSFALFGSHNGGMSSKNCGHSGRLEVADPGYQYQHRLYCWVRHNVSLHVRG